MESLEWVRYLMRISKYECISARLYVGFEGLTLPL